MNLPTLRRQIGDSFNAKTCVNNTAATVQSMLLTRQNPYKVLDKSVDPSINYLNSHTF
jgi:hypothetical protein